ncbi:unnamed protein product [Bursaphelenchus okinawaensis]|uniref:Integrator complex subunit 7 n=1 Tax=Bursaphelenchus okinawaensis TaxID=465554 RepID=A0A811KBK5_9BILA|nr:unnamed protein product [Bursaphelenchus okinawaensis]CAG9099371.1 unnamed protein product [Bursaphelenchus okinawaensis]
MNTLTQIERALQSSNLSDQLSAIAECPKAIRENPFPLFVNALLLRLADAFNGEKLVKMDHPLNLIRLRIVKLLKECGVDLAVVFSRDEIVRKVMKVSHSNDYKSRALTMLFFAAAAPIVHSNKKVHHLLVEGADCTDLTELTAAIVSVGHLGKFSAEFSSLIVDKIGDMVAETQTEENLKVRLMDDLSLFQENIVVTRQCMELGRSLLHNNPDKKVSLVVLNALTELAVRNGLALNEQIDLLLSEMPNFIKGRRFTMSFMANLTRLAEYPQHWTTEQVVTIRDVLTTLVASGFYESITLWLDCMTLLSHRIHTDVTGEVIPNLLELLSNEKFLIRLRTVQLLLDLSAKPPRKFEEFIKGIKPLIGTTLLHIINELNEKPLIVSQREKARYYRNIIKLLRNGTCSSYFVEDDSVIDLFKEGSNSYEKPHSLLVLEALNAIVDAIPWKAKSLNEWALSRLKTVPNGQLNQQSDFIFNLALLPVKENKEKLVELVERVTAEIKQDNLAYFAYKFARNGFRYGGWSAVAFPALEVIQDRCQTVETSAFLAAITIIAGAQLPQNVNSQALRSSRQSLNHALLLLLPLAKNSPNSHNFTFPVAFIKGISQLFEATNTVFVFMNILLDSDPLAFGPAHMEYVVPDIQQAREEFENVREHWRQLQQRSFDADPHTLCQLELLARHAQICEMLLDRLYTVELTPIDLFPKSAENVTNAKLDQVLEWAITQGNQCLVPVTGTISERLNAWKSNLQVFNDIFHHLANPFLSLPRFFFQQLWRTSIRVNILPQPREHESYLQLTSRQLPLTVEGVIESNNPKGIESVYISVFVKSDKAVDNFLVDKRKVNVNKDTYFKERFLLTIKKLTEITVKLQFTDASHDVKKLWIAENEEKLLVSIPERKEDF